MQCNAVRHTSFLLLNGLCIWWWKISCQMNCDFIRYVDVYYTIQDIRAVKNRTKPGSDDKKEGKNSWKTLLMLRSHGTSKDIRLWYFNTDFYHPRKYLFLRAEFYTSWLMTHSLFYSQSVSQFHWFLPFRSSIRVLLSFEHLLLC